MSDSKEAALIQVAGQMAIHIDNLTNGTRHRQHSTIQSDLMLYYAQSYAMLTALHTEKPPSVPLAQGAAKRK